MSRLLDDLLHAESADADSHGHRRSGHPCSSATRCLNNASAQSCKGGTVVHVVGGRCQIPDRSGLPSARRRQRRRRPISRPGTSGFGAFSHCPPASTRKDVASTAAAHSGSHSQVVHIHLCIVDPRYREARSGKSSRPIFPRHAVGRGFVVRGRWQSGGADLMCCVPVCEESMSRARSTSSRSCSRAPGS